MQTMVSPCICQEATRFAICTFVIAETFRILACITNKTVQVFVMISSIGTVVCEVLSGLTLGTYSRTFKTPFSLRTDCARRRTNVVRCIHTVIINKLTCRACLARSRPYQGKLARWAYDTFINRVVLCRVDTMLKEYHFRHIFSVAHLRQEFSCNARRACRRPDIGPLAWTAHATIFNGVVSGYS